MAIMLPVHGSGRRYSEEQNLIPSCIGYSMFVLWLRTDVFVVPRSLQTTFSVQGEEY